MTTAATTTAHKVKPLYVSVFLYYFSLKMYTFQNGKVENYDTLNAINILLLH